MYSKYRWAAFLMYAAFVFALYVPVRMAAQKFNAVSNDIAVESAALPDEQSASAPAEPEESFRYPLCIVLWPVYSLALTFILFMAAVKCRVPWYFQVVLAILVALLWKDAGALDALLGIAPGGLRGFNAYTGSGSEMNATQLSMILSVVGLALGAAFGLVGGIISRAASLKD